MSYDGFKNITIQQLEALIHLVGERSFSRAARKMFLTQPSLTKHIKNLEDAVGVKVINRHNTGVTLTFQGKLLYEYAQKILGLREGVKEKIFRSMEKESGTIDIIASTIPANYILPFILGNFNKKYPKIKVYIKTVNSEEALDMVMNNHAEIGFIGKKTLSRKISAEPIWKDRLVIAVSGTHRWSKRRSITAEELMEEPFVIREKGSGTREILENYLKEKAASDFKLNIIAELGSSEAIKEAIIAGLGVSFISIHAIRRELKQKLLVEIPVSGWVVERDFHVIYTKQLNLMPHQKIFLNFCKTALPPS
ncbi:MAG: LysR family transcriptional regulator [Thermodesulfobacteriota bacterium]|nr:LysR family transcriptional regulator [Thermodesulfobacteriota bacterium]